MDWLTAVAKSVAEGKSGSQFAIPDGVHVGDLFFITDEKNKIMIAFSWTGVRWHPISYESIEIQDRAVVGQTPDGLKPISIKRT